MYKSIVFALVAAASTLGAASAHAGVSWSIGINAPVVGAVISNRPAYPVYSPVYEQSYEPAYAPVPAYVPAPVYSPAPVYVAPPVVYYPRRSVYVRPVPIVYPRFYGGWRGGDWHGGHGGRGHDRHDGHGGRR